MIRPSVNPGPVADEAPTAPAITDYDRQYLIVYIMLLDAVRDGIDRDSIAREVLQIDPVAEAGRAVRAFETHLARARWMTTHGYRHLLNDSSPARPE
ncbi:MAG: DUF2285 domain-containing protein [Rhodopila sp.]|nr:DUF2285 domain-containing protein [Rhodopila sp.]